MKVNPGSLDAIKLGCTCPVMDNAHGRGAFIKDGQVMFWYSQDCTVHNTQEDTLLNEIKELREVAVNHWEDVDDPVKFVIESRHDDQ